MRNLIDAFLGGTLGEKPSVTMLWRVAAAIGRAESKMLEARLASLKLPDDFVIVSDADDNATEDYRDTHTKLLVMARENLDELVIERLTANRRHQVLLQPQDAELVVDNMLTGVEFASKDREFVTFLAQPYTRRLIAGEINFLSAIRDDLYEAAWVFMSAIIIVASQANVELDDVAEDSTLRARVYRNTFTSGQWLRYADSTLRHASTMTVAEFTGGFGNILEGQDAIEYAKTTARQEAAFPAYRDRLVALIGEYLDERMRAMWPV